MAPILVINTPPTAVHPDCAQTGRAAMSAAVKSKTMLRAFISCLHKISTAGFGAMATPRMFFPAEENVQRQMAKNK
jgi:hypothetical protein